MADVVFVLIVVAFFAVAVGYVEACAALIGRDTAESSALDRGVDESEAVPA